MKRFNIKQLSKLVLIPVFALGLFFSSCEEIIELEPFNQVNEATGFTSPSLVELSVVGMYNAAQIGWYGGGNRGYPFGAAFVQQGDARGEDAVNMFAFYQFTYEGNHNPTTLNNVHYWGDTYRAINRCNIVIEGVRTAATNGIITAEAALRYEGEARLLRAALYHELLLHFAYPFRHPPAANGSHWGVPYHDKPFTTIASVEEGKTKGRETVAFVYGKILEDLDFAELNLPLRAGWAGSYRMTRGTRGAAAAYKLRIHQHMHNWPAAVTEGNKFVTGGPYAIEYALGAEPWTMWGDYASNEYIFGMENSATNNPGVNGALAQMYKRRQLVCISPIIWRNTRWLPDDKRRRVPEMVTNVGGRMFTNKYRDDGNQTDPSPMKRFAEVLLNLAEAIVRNDLAGMAGPPNSVALGHLNRVRNRALANPAAQAYTLASFATNRLLLEAILHERRIEFAMEGRRWPDIHRLQHCPEFPIAGIPAKLPNSQPAPALFTLGTEVPAASRTLAAIPYTDHRFLWPIPLVEINANPTLAQQQNPGW